MVLSFVQAGERRIQSIRLRESISLTSISSIVLPLLCGLIITGNVMADPLSGPAFTDPAHSENLPDEWRGKVIERNKWQPVDSAPVDIAVTLDQHLYPALQPLIREYARTHALRIAVQEGTCGISAGKLVDKEVDIAGFCCPPGETDRLPGLRYHTLGIAALALLVNPDNRQNDMSLAQARSIFQGRVRHWEALRGADSGGNNTVIRPIVRLHCKSRPGHWRLMLGSEDMFGPQVYEVSTIPDMISRVAHQPEAIGYEVLWMAEQHRDKGAVKALSIDGVSPEDDVAVATGRYPLYRTYNITTWTGDVTSSHEAEGLVTYLQNNFEKVDRRYGIIPSKILRERGWKFSGSELIAAPTR
jgi:ABC-type phosphate transport system substrate-binding protein